MRLAAFLATTLALVSPAFAEGFQRVEGRDRFLSVVQDRDLTRLGIRVKVTDRGQIVGRAFGQNVTGDWSWKDGYFCRDLYWGGSKLDLGNCQLVEVNGNTVRFTSDKGTGDYADLRIK
ncbi:MAG: dihydrodipicolinate reductase [Silicimonas sp.]|nr:dihydrodipicolinate reductase [Silicimonas sp.]